MPLGGGRFKKADRLSRILTSLGEFTASEMCLNPRRQESHHVPYREEFHRLPGICMVLKCSWLWNFTSILCVWITARHKTFSLPKHLSRRICRCPVHRPGPAALSLCLEKLLQFHRQQQPPLLLLLLCAPFCFLRSEKSIWQRGNSSSLCGLKTGLLGLFFLSFF